MGCGWGLWGIRGVVIASCNSSHFVMLCLVIVVIKGGPPINLALIFGKEKMSFSRFMFAERNFLSRSSSGKMN